MTNTPTSVEINGQAFELNHISVEEAKKLYEALSTVNAQTNYKELADKISAIVVNYQSIVSVKLPEGKTFRAAMQEYFDALKNGGGQLVDGSADYLQEILKTPFGKSIQESGVYQTADAAANLLGTIQAYASALPKGFAFPVTAYGAIKEGTHNAINYLDGKFNPISKEQADSIGAVYAAAVYKAVDAPEAPDTTKRPEPNWWDQSKARVTSWVHMLPEGISTFLITLGTWVSDGFRGKGFDWAKASESAKQDALAYKADPKNDYERLLGECTVGKVQEKVRATAAETLSQVEEVAGQSTNNLSSLVKDGGIYRDNDGKWNTLSFDSQGMPNSHPMEMPKGKENKHKIATIAGIGTGATVAIIGPGKGFAQGVLSHQELTTSIVGKNGMMAVESKQLLMQAEQKMDAAIKAGQGTVRKIIGIRVGRAPDAQLAAELRQEAMDLIKQSGTLSSKTAPGSKVGNVMINLASTAQETKPWWRLDYHAGRAAGWCAKQLGFGTTETAVMQMENLGVASTTKLATKVAGTAVPILNVAPDAIEYVSAVVNGADAHTQTKAAASVSIVGSCTAIGFWAGSFFPVVGNGIGAGLGACVGSAISYFTAEPIANATCGKPGEQKAAAAKTDVKAEAPKANAQPVKDSIQPQSLVMMEDPELTRLAADSTMRARNAQTAAVLAASGMNVHKVQLGAVGQPGAPAPFGTNQTTGRQVTA